jgi:acetyl esterase/lipase
VGRAGGRRRWRRVLRAHRRVRVRPRGDQAVRATARGRAAAAGRAALTRVAALLAALALLAGCGSDGDGTERLVVGSGTREAVVLRAADAERGRPVVVFLHGWTADEDRQYGAWLRHLVGRGADVVFPVYQRPPFDDVRTPLGNVQAALRAALARLPGHGPVLVAGHSAGGALSSDLAASAAQAGLPQPVAVYAVYPGRDLGPGRFLAGPPLSRIPPDTQLLALASPTDRVVGTETARSMVAGATRVRGRLRIVSDPVLGEHNAPMGSSAEVRAAFWAPLDRLLRQAEAQRDR